MSLRVVFGCDHTAAYLKDTVLEIIKACDTVSNVAYVGPNEEKSVDYPDNAARVCEPIQRGEADLGLLLCGTGIGMSISANKFKGIRAALCHEHVTASLCREHNDANVACMGVRTLGIEVIRDIITTYLTTGFSNGERHVARLAKVRKLEDGQACSNGKIVD